MTWLLLVFSISGYNGSSPAVAIHEMTSEKSCLAAAAVVNSQATYMNVKPLRAFCVQK